MNDIISQPFIAIILATNRPEQVKTFFENLQNTGDDYNNFEVLIRADEGDDATINAINDIKQKVDFRVHLLIEKNQKGTFLMHYAYNRLIMEFASPSVYFFWNLTDEIRIEKKGWDTDLKKYIKFYQDDIFRLKPTYNNINNYYNFKQCLSVPDNYSVFTRRWLELVGGWGDYWGTDTWHQAIDWYLGKCQLPVVPHALFRSLPIFSIKMIGQADGQILSSGQSANRRKKMANDSFNILLSLAARENFNRLAKRLYLHYIAKHKNLNEYFIREDRFSKRMILADVDNNIIDVVDWGLRFHHMQEWLISKTFSYLSEKNANFIVEKTKRIFGKIRNLYFGYKRAVYNIIFKEQVNYYTQYHFKEGQNKFFNSDYNVIKDKIQNL